MSCLKIYEVYRQYNGRFGSQTDFLIHESGKILPLSQGYRTLNPDTKYTHYSSACILLLLYFIQVSVNRHLLREFSLSTLPEMAFPLLYHSPAAFFSTSSDITSCSGLLVGLLVDWMSECTFPRSWLPFWGSSPWMKSAPLPGISTEMHPREA